MPVNFEHSAYKKAVPLWTRCRDAFAGEQAIHERGEKYLPKLALEDEVQYLKRKNRTGFFNATRRTISGYYGMVFRKEPVVTIPAALEEYAADIDMSGTSLISFSQKIVMDVLTVARAGILVDMPVALDMVGATVKQVESAGIRPTLKMYHAESIINWKTIRYNNRTVLGLVVLTEEVSVPGDDEFENGSETQYRVLDLVEGRYRQRVFKIDTKTKKQYQVGEDIFPMKAGSSIDFIPFVIIGTTNNHVDVEEPPLMDLVDVNLHHYSVNADYEECCHKMIPTLFVSGYSPPVEGGGGIYLGGSVANCLPHPDSKAWFAEPENDFEGLRNNLKDKRDMMAVLGARMLETQRPGVEAAETAAQHRKGEESLLSSITQVIGQGLTQALTWFADWAGISGEIKYELNKDFLPMPMTPQQLTALVTSWQQGAISFETLFSNLKQGEIIDNDISVEDEQSRIDSSGPTLARVA